MTAPVDFKQAVGFLADVQRLFNNGESDDALELVDLYLTENPNDIEARLLKAEICLATDCETEFVGQVLAELRPPVIETERAQRLKASAEKTVRDNLANGRMILSQRYPELPQVLGCFDRAIKLAPDDPSVPLAAGLALMKTDRVEPTSRSPLDVLDSILSGGRSSSSSRQRRGPSQRQLEAIENYLVQAIDSSTPGSQTRRLATQHLLRHRLENGQIGPALEMLEAAPEPEEMFGSLVDDVLGVAVLLALSVAVTLIRTGQWEQFEQVLATCAEATPDLPMLTIARADALAQAGRTQEAMDAYRALLEMPDQDVQFTSRQAVRAAWEAACSIEMVCEHCGKSCPADRSQCVVCGMPLGEGELLLDRYELDISAKVTIAHVGLAELFGQQGQPAAALRHLDAALDALPQRHPAIPRLRTLRREYLQGSQSGSAIDHEQAQRLLAAFRQDGLTPAVIAGIHQLCQTSPTAWFGLPVQSRLAVVRRLMAGERFDLAQQVLDAACADNPARPSVRKLADRLAAAVRARQASLLAEAQAALADGRLERASSLGDAVLAMRADHAPARLVRGRARLASGQGVLALDDFYAALRLAQEEETRRSAAMGAAMALARGWEFVRARRILDGIDGEQAAALRARLDRRLRDEPVVRVQPVSSVVMYDTLTRAETSPQYQGFFAVAVRSVGRPWNASREDWVGGILNAGLEFVKVLGGLRHASGFPVFALRLISHPHPDIAERGRLALALVVRVSASSEDECRTLAGDLWRMLAGLLPATDRHAYNFEVVVDAAELDSLLQPFEVGPVAEIVRREDVPQADDDRYAVYPFTPGALDWHGLCRSLLRQKAPAMVSLHLLPSDLMAWELAAIDQMMVGEAGTGLRQAGEIGRQMPDDPIADWWQNAPRLGQAQTNRYQLDCLRAGAYVLRVNVAGAAGTSPLLPETVAAAMFGPVYPANGALIGGYEVVRPNSAAEHAIARRNLAEMDVEGWVYSAAPAGAARMRHLVAEREAALVFRLPVPGPQGLPGVPVIDAKPIAPPSGLPAQGTALGVSVMRVKGMPLRITQSVDDRRRHTYIVGKTGVGKSTLLGSMALQDIEAGAGVCVVDPHGDLVEDILLRIPPHRADDVIVFDPSDEARPIGLNLLEARSEPEKHRIVTEFIGLLIRMYDPIQQGIVGPRFQHNVRNAMLTAMSLESGTLIEVVRVLSDRGFVKAVLPYVTDPIVRTYWEKQIANTSDFHRSEILDYIVSKFSRFVGDRLVRNIIGQRHTTVNFREIMDHKRILLVNLSKGKIGPESAQFLGLLLVQRLLLTALSRADVPVDQRPDFFLYVDEFQNFATDMFATVLSEGRKYGVAVTVANQYLSQLDAQIREAIFGNVGSIVSFRLGTKDAVLLAPEMFPVFGVDDLLNLPKFTACVKLLVDGVAARPFTMQTVPDTRLPDPARAEAIRERSRQEYGRDEAEVSADVLARFKMD